MAPKLEQCHEIMKQKVSRLALCRICAIAIAIVWMCLPCVEFRQHLRNSMGQSCYKYAIKSTRLKTASHSKKTSHRNCARSYGVLVLAIEHKWWSDPCCWLYSQAMDMPIQLEQKVSAMYQLFLRHLFRPYFSQWEKTRVWWKLLGIPSLQDRAASHPFDSNIVFTWFPTLWLWRLQFAIENHHFSVR